MFDNKEIISPDYSLIEDGRTYRPSQIVKNGWVLGTSQRRNYSSYNYVLKLLKSGALLGVDYSIPGSKMVMWKVYGSEIKRYLREVERIAI